MGTDDIFKKSKAKRTTNKLLKRQVGNINTLKRVLVVSEGKKTEPIYFDYLVSKLKLTSAENKCSTPRSKRLNSCYRYSSDQRNKANEAVAKRLGLFYFQYYQLNVGNEPLKWNTRTTNILSIKTTTSTQDIQ